MNKKKHIWVFIGSVLVFTSVYLISPGVRYSVQDAVHQMANADIAGFRAYLLSFGVWAPFVSAFFMILAVVIAPLPTFVPTFANGLLFGTLWGSVLSWTSALVGAVLTFYIARLLGRPVVLRLVPEKTFYWTDHFFFSIWILRCYHEQNRSRFFIWNG